MKSWSSIIKGVLFALTATVATSTANAATIEATNMNAGEGFLTSDGYLIDLTAFNVIDGVTNTSIDVSFLLDVDATGAGTLTIGSLLTADVSNFDISSDPFGGGLFSASLSYTGGSMMGSLTSGNLTGNYSTSDVIARVSEVQAVPVPAAVWLFGSGLIGLAGIARRKAIA